MGSFIPLLRQICENGAAGATVRRNGCFSVHCRESGSPGNGLAVSPAARGDSPKQIETSASAETDGGALWHRVAVVHVVTPDYAAGMPLMPGPEHPSRRHFVATVGAAVVAGALPAARHDRTAEVRAARRRGLALNTGDFLFDTGLTYLQTGSLGPSPTPVIDATIASWRELERNPVVYGYGRHEKMLDDVRAQAATFIGCTTDELVLTNCTTDGMNWVAQGLTLAAGDRVLTSDQEHPGGRVCWDYVVRRSGIALDVVPIPPTQHDATQIVDAFAQRITSRTRVLSFSHINSSTGLRMPVRELSALARSRGCIAVVDGAQAVGAIDVNVKALGCHVYATSGHKWLLAPKGTGLLYLSADIGTAVDPIALQSGRGGYTASSGVCSLPSVAGLGAAMSYHAKIGKARIETNNLALRQRVHDGLLGVPKLRVVSPARGALASPMLSYQLPDRIKSHELYEVLLSKHRVVVKVVPGNWFNGHRISTHLFNDPADVEALMIALRAELA